MKVKELKYWLSLIDEEENVILDQVGSMESIYFCREGVCLCGHNFECDDKEITISNVNTYLKKKRNEKK